VVAGAVKHEGLGKVGLVGTLFSMEDPFFVDRLASHGLEVLVPDERHHEMVNAIIYGELVHGKVLDGSRSKIVALIEELWDAGAQGVILGCTELELLVKQADSELPIFPCTTLHVEAALDRALAD
jgi:aspartate racemase